MVAQILFRGDRSAMVKTAKPATTLPPIVEIPPNPSSLSTIELMNYLRTNLKAPEAIPLADEVEKRIADKDTQIADLIRYKEKWRNLKRDARRSVSNTSGSSPKSTLFELSSSLSSTPEEKKSS